MMFSLGDLVKLKAIDDLVQVTNMHELNKYLRRDHDLTLNDVMNRQAIVTCVNDLEDPDQEVWIAFVDDKREKHLYCFMSYELCFAVNEPRINIYDDLKNMLL